MSRRMIAAVILSMAAVRAYDPPGEKNFDQGMQAAVRNEWPRALDLLERALLEDPDNLRYGSEYRQTVLRCARAYHPKDGKVEDFDRSLGFFEQLTQKHSDAPNAYLNYGFALVDKIPAAGSISQVILANNALNNFSRSLELRPSWVGYYTRGVSYLFWPAIFGRAKLGVADLETALKMQGSVPRRPYHVRTWIALGDGYWKIDDIDKARDTWARGLQEFPDDAALQNRVHCQGDALKSIVEDALDPSKRVDTDLREMWSTQ